MKVQECAKFWNKHHHSKNNCELNISGVLLYTDVHTLEMRVIYVFIGKCKLKNKAVQKKG